MSKNKKTLHDIISNYQQIEMQLIESGGEINEVLESLLSINESELNDKLDGYEKFTRYLKGQIDYLKSMESLYVKRRKILENSIQKCRQSMVSALTVTGKNKIRTKEFNFSIGKTEKWEVEIEQLSDEIKNNLIKEDCAENIFKLNLSKFKNKYKNDTENIPDWINVSENLFIRVS